MLERINLPVISYCSIPESITDGHWISENSCDSYVKYTVTKIEDQAKFDDDFSIDNWILKSYPELGGQEVLIHIDY